MSLKQKRNPNGIAQIHLGGVTKNRPSPLVYVAGKYKLGPGQANKCKLGPVKVAAIWLST